MNLHGVGSAGSIVPGSSTPITSEVTAPASPLHTTDAEAPAIEVQRPERRTTFFDTVVGRAIELAAHFIPTSLRGAVLGAGMLSLVISGQRAFARTIAIPHRVEISAKDTPLVRLLRELGKDGWISNTDFETRAARMLAELPARPTAEMRALLRFYVESVNTEGPGRIVFDDDVTEAIFTRLRAAGFAIEPPERSRPTLVDMEEMLVRSSGKPPPSVRELRRLFSGKTIDLATFDAAIRPTLWRVPAVASESGRELVHIYADPSVRLTPEAAAAFATLIQRSGYGVPRDRRLSPSEAQRIIRDAIGEIDSVFARYSNAIGGAKPIHIGVIDGGFELTHPAIKSKLAANEAEIAGNNRDDDKNGIVDDVYGYNAMDSTANLFMERGYSDHGNNVLGIATRGAPLISATVITASGVNVPGQIEYLARRGVRIVNMSVDYPVPSVMKEWRSAMETHPELLFVVAARNEGKPMSALPEEIRATYAPLPNLIVVTAADDSGKQIEGTNWEAPWVTIGARSMIRSAITFGGYRTGQMSSMATPNVSNVAAKCAALDPALTAAELKQIIIATSQPSDDWAARVEARGLLDGDGAAAVAAMTALLRRGYTPEDAAAKLGISADAKTYATALAMVLNRQ